MSRPATASQKRGNPNFVRPEDPQRSAVGTNFVSRESSDLRARQVESMAGVAVRRVGESDAEFRRRSKDVAKDRKGERTRAVMAPTIARHELAQLEQKWNGRVPTEEEAVRYEDEFAYMNDCRASLGWPEIDYTQARESAAATNAAKDAFVAFAKKPERDRIAICRDSEDLPLMRIAATHDDSEDVRVAANDRMQLLWAKQSAS